MILTAEQATGGTLTTTSDGRKAVGFPVMTPLESRYAWNWSAPLAPGWWEVTVTFSPLAGDSQRQLINFESGHKPAIDLNEIDQTLVASSLHLWFYSSAPVSALKVRPSRMVQQPMRPIVQIQFRESKTPEGSRDPILLDLEFSGTNEIRLPAGLSAGNWKLIPQFEDPKNASGSLVVTGDKGGVVKAPLSRQISIFTSESPRALSWDAGVKINGMILQYITPYSPKISLKLEGNGMAARDENQTVRGVLIMKGAQPIAELPILPILPNGKKVAVVTSWDDGVESDMQCSKILNQHGYKGTFFVNEFSPVRKKYLGEMEKLGMEIASHSVNHPRGWLISPQQWKDECLQLRLSLEQSLGHPVISFAYPFDYVPAYDIEGDYVLRGARSAGYWSARTAAAREETINGYAEPLTLSTNGHFLQSFEKLDASWQAAHTQEGGVFYFWGHTYEIKPPKDWDYFEALLSRYEKKPEAWYATQGQLFIWRWLRANTRWEKIKESAEGTEFALTHPKLDPYLQKECPLSIKVPAGVTKILWQNQELPIVDGYAVIP